MKKRTLAAISSAAIISFFSFLALQSSRLIAQPSAENKLQEPTPEILKPDEGDVIWFFSESKTELGPGGELQIFMDHHTHPEAVGSFAKFILGAGGELPAHRHEKTEEIAYILSGEGTAIYFEDGEEREAKIAEGYVWYNPKAAWHAVRNEGDKPLVMVFATIPNEEKGLLSFFRKIGAKPGEEPPTFSPEEFSAIASSHDLILKQVDSEGQ